MCGLKIHNFLNINMYDLKFGTHYQYVIEYVITAFRPNRTCNSCVRRRRRFTHLLGIALYTVACLQYLQHKTFVKPSNNQKNIKKILYRLTTMPRLTENQRLRVFGMQQAGELKIVVARRFGVHVNTISSLWRRYQHTDSTRDYP